MNNASRLDGIFGLFPSLVPVGGIQTSGRLVADRFFIGDDGNPRTTASSRNFLFTYGPEGPVAAQSTNRNTVHSNTKVRAMRQILSRTWDYPAILLWHIHFTRLLP